MNMMKKMYDEGDDTMKKVPHITICPMICPAHRPKMQTIGEAMLKSRMGGGASAPGGDLWLRRAEGLDCYNIRLAASNLSRKAEVP